MSDLDELYQELILDHTKRPRNFREMPDATRHVDGHNPLCGDRLRLFVKIEDGRIIDASFKGAGCSISTASASLMTEAIRGKTVAEARDLFARFHDLLTNSHHNAAADEALGKLSAFAGVQKFPVRVKCATLPWQTLNAALTGTEEPVSTE